MSKGWKRFLITCGVVFSVGFVFMLVGILFGGFESFSQIKQVGFQGDENSFSVITEKELEKFHTVTIDVDRSDVQLVAGDSYKVEIVGNRSRIPDIVQREDHLEIIAPTSSSRIHLGGNLLEKLWSKFQGTTSVRVYYPREESLEKVDIQTAMGNIQVEEIQWQQGLLHTEYGNITCEETKAEKVEIQTEMGDISFGGTISIQGDLDTELGDIDAQGDFTGAFTAETEMGEIQLVLANTLEDYDYSLDTELGDVIINGDSKNRASLTKEEGKPNQLDLDTELGDIQVMNLP